MARTTVLPRERWGFCLCWALVSLEHTSVMKCCQDSLALLSPSSFEPICFHLRTAGHLLIVKPDSCLSRTYIQQKTKVRSYKCSGKLTFLCCKQELGELSQLTLSRWRWMPSSRGHTPPSVRRCKCHWQQCPPEDQYSRIRRSLKQMTFPIIFHSRFFIFLSWHLFSHVCIHIKAANS